MGNVYLWKAGGHVVYHTSLEAAAQLDGLSRQPDKTVTEARFSEAGSLARVINNKIVLGKTPQEEADEKARKRIVEIDARFAAIEKEIVRPMIAHIKGSPDQRDVNKLTTLDFETQKLRTERAQIIQSLSAPLE
jgi:polyribonucleotide nucleotidyltransferase